MGRDDPDLLPGGSRPNAEDQLAFASQRLQEPGAGAAVRIHPLGPRGELRPLRREHPTQQDGSPGGRLSCEGQADRRSAGWPREAEDEAITPVFGALPVAPKRTADPRPAVPRGDQAHYVAAAQVRGFNGREARSESMESALRPRNDPGVLRPVHYDELDLVDVLGLL